jgi:hypothetical protein
VQATLGAGPWQHVGWGANGFRDRWAIVSTAETGTTVYARTFDGGIELRTALAGVSPGVAHDYRVAWGPTQVEYYVDGALAARHLVAIGNAMYVYASNNGAADVTVDFLAGA